MKKIKILHVASTSLGGIGRHLLSLVKYMDKDSFEMSFAIPPDSPFYDDIVKTGTKVYPLSIDRQPFRYCNIRGFWQLINIMRAERFDIVHSHTEVGGFMGRITAKIVKTPLVLWSIHAWAFDCPNGTVIGRQLFKIISKMLAQFTDHYVAISENMKSVGVNAGITLPEKVDVIYHGIEVIDFGEKDKVIRKILGINEDSIIIGTVGRLDPQKAMDVLVKAVSLVREEYPDITLIIVGDGPLRKELEELSAELRLSDNLIITGWQKHESVYEYIAAMDIFCLSSRWESFGLVLLEAMLAGKPIVATGVGGIPEVVKDKEGGLIVPYGEPEEMARCICLLLSDLHLRLRMGDYNKKRVGTSFNIAGMVKKIELLYRSLAQSV